MRPYYFAKTLPLPLPAAEEQVTAGLKEAGFGVLTEIDVQATMKQKLDADMPPYKILGACNPHFAYQALQAENKIGTMLPCNVILQEVASGRTEVAAVDPVASMQAIDNPALASIAEAVRERLKHVIEQL